MNRPGIRILELLEQAAKAATDDQGHFNQDIFVKEANIRLTSDELPPHVKDELERNMAKGYANRFVRSRRPKASDNDGLFKPESILMLGRGERVWMAKATVTDLLSWHALSTDNVAKVAAAHSIEARYVGSRLDAMKARPNALLGEIEETLFGWTDSGNSDDGSSDDDDDE